MTDGAVEQSLKLMETAKQMLLKDKAVASMTLLFRDGEAPVPVLAAYRDDEQKRHVLDEALPSLVREEVADGVALVAAAWVNGQDCIVVTAEQRDGRAAMWMTPYVKSSLGASRWVRRRAAWTKARTTCSTLCARYGPADKRRSRSLSVVGSRR